MTTVWPNKSPEPTPIGAFGQSVTPVARSHRFGVAQLFSLGGFKPMRFYTPKECEEWCQVLQVPLDDQRQPVHEPTHQHRLRCAFPPSDSQFLWFSRCIESALQPRQTCLLWVTGFGIFPSCENQHLYYRLRQSYGDIRSAPRGTRPLVPRLRASRSRHASSSLYAVWLGCSFDSYRWIR